jgi:hypothetical protein
MMDNAKTASAVANKFLSGSDTLTAESYGIINAYVDEILDVWQGEVDKGQIMGLFREESQTQDLYKVKMKNRPNITIPLSRDTDDLRFATGTDGFSHEFRMYQYRLAVKAERRLLEVDNVGAVTDRFDWLIEGADRTFRNAAMDVFARAVKPTNAPFLCPDGMYMIDSDRPNPDPRVPKWSNELVDMDITDEALFAMVLAAKNQIGPNGERLNLKIKKFLIPQEYDQVAWVLSNSPKKINSTANDANWSNGRFTFEVFDDGPSATIFAVLDDTKGKKNGLQFRWGEKPNLKDLSFVDPDIMGKRIRFRFGTGCLDPRYVWLGAVLNAL